MLIKCPVWNQKVRIALGIRILLVCLPTSKTIKMYCFYFTLRPQREQKFPFLLDPRSSSVLFQMSGSFWGGRNINTFGI